MAKLTIQEAGWRGDEVLKYQACIETPGTDGHTRRIWGAPAKTKTLAQQDLIAEVGEWATFIKEAKASISRLKKRLGQ